ncbi:glutathione S-transferase [Novosphingobium hassiacum]|uniref:Glutathione S-transferase n=1 Tax=Novosphingobium hassiacum TaxID=173676 RepID=A0A7W5ZS68_9SPHN|nr:glutathione S-transferase family protein [Novosphingobium hassiacum]MBB3859026.1 glutathione S-transferase [Novosphingobium hassiacum]
MANALVFYTNPQSRGQIIRWMLEEVGAPYETQILDYASTMKAPEYLAINPMGKVPAIRHGDQIITECAAICAYLADAFPEAGLLPAPADRGAYFRWLFFAAGPIEAAFTAKAVGWEVPADKQGMVGFGNFDLAIDTIAGAVDGKAFIAGDRFSAADVYVASMLDFLIAFGMLPPRPAFDAYLAPLRERPAYHRAKEIDAALMPKS